MKKLFAIITAAAMLLALSACGSKERAATEVTDPNVQAKSEIKLIASNFHYDQPEYHAKKGEPVRITLESKQGVHGALISELGVELHGSHLSTVIIPDKTGTYEIRCDVPCGSGHLNMVSKLIVE